MRVAANSDIVRGGELQRELGDLGIVTSCAHAPRILPPSRIISRVIKTQFQFSRRTSIIYYYYYCNVLYVLMDVV